MQSQITSSLTVNVTMETISSVYKDPSLELTYRILVPAILAVIMFIVGCDITWDSMKAHLRRPLGPLIGALCQFGLLPLAAFGLSLMLNLPKEQALGVVIVSSCPGGAVSNIFTYWTDGDLSLSVCMTTLSTALSLGFMPLNIFLYSQRWTAHKAKIPYDKICLSLVLVIVPVILGAFFKRKWPNAARILIKVGTVAGLILIIVAGAIQGRLYPEVFGASWKLWVAAILFTPMGFVLGFCISSIICMSYHIRRTIGIETGVQNAGVALTVVALTFKGKESAKYSLFPLVFAAFQMVSGITFVLVYRLYYYKLKSKPKTSEDNITPLKDEEIRT